MELHHYNIGDKIVCINDQFELNEDSHLFTYPKLMEVYTVRDTYDQSVYLEEIINPKLPDYDDEEICFYHWRFVKLLELENQEEEQEIEVLTLTI